MGSCGYLRSVCLHEAPRPASIVVGLQDATSQTDFHAVAASFDETKSRNLNLKSHVTMIEDLF
jgi:hypothetical protein